VQFLDMRANRQADKQSDIQTHRHTLIVIILIHAGSEVIKHNVWSCCRADSDESCYQLEVSTRGRDDYFSNI